MKAYKRVSSASLFLAFSLLLGLMLSGCSNGYKIGPYRGLVYDANIRPLIKLQVVEKGVFLAPGGFQLSRAGWTVEMAFEVRKDRTYRFKDATSVKFNSIIKTWSDGTLKITPDGRKIIVEFYEINGGVRSDWKYNGEYPVDQL